MAVIEQNKRPYGKIEDGLPRWHVEQRKQEYARIDARLRKPGVYFIPSTKLGRDVDFRDLCIELGLFRGHPGERRVARPGFGSARRGKVCRQGPGLSESLHLLVQPQERKDLRRAALRDSGRNAGRGRRPGLDRRGEGPAARELRAGDEGPRHRDQHARTGERHPGRVQGARHQAGRSRREGLPVDLSPPRAGHAAGAAAGQRNAGADREDRAGPPEDASPGAGPIPVSVSGSKADDRPRRRERAAGRFEGGGNQSRRTEGRTDSRLRARVAGSPGDFLDRIGAGDRSPGVAMKGEYYTFTG